MTYTLTVTSAFEDCNSTRAKEAESWFDRVMRIMVYEIIAVKMTGVTRPDAMLLNKVPRVESNHEALTGFVTIDLRDRSKVALTYRRFMRSAFRQCI